MSNQLSASACGVPRAGRHRIASRVAIGIAGGALLSIAIHFGRPAPRPATPVANAPADSSEANTTPLPRMVLSAIVGATDRHQRYALISLAGAPAREFHSGDQVAEGVQLLSISSNDVTLVARGLMFKLVVETRPATTQPNPRIAVRSPSDWRNAASTRSVREPATAPVTVVAPTQGFDAASSSTLDRAVWRARQMADAP